MALKTQRGQVVVRNQVQIPVVDWKTLGKTENNKAFKSFFTTHFVPLGNLVMQDEEAYFELGGVNTDQAKTQIFKYSWSQPDEEKPAKKGEMPLSWRSEMWSDTNLRIADGDAYDDPGVALGLTLKQDARKNAPGLHGAPQGKYPMFDPYVQTVRMPVIWNVTVDDDGNIDENTGELVWLELSFNQYANVMTSIAKYAKQQILQDKRRKEPTPADRLFVVKYTKDPKKEMREINSVEVFTYIDPNAWTSKFSDIAVVEYPKMLDYLEKRYTYYKPVIDSLVTGELTPEQAASKAHAMVAERLLVAWGEIDENSGLSEESINQLFVSLIPQYSASMEVAIPSAAIKSTVTIDLADGDVPF